MEWTIFLLSFTRFCKFICATYILFFRRKNRWELTKISAAVMGIEFSYAAETAFVSPTLLKIGKRFSFNEILQLSWTNDKRWEIERIAIVVNYVVVTFFTKKSIRIILSTSSLNSTNLHNLLSGSCRTYYLSVTSLTIQLRSAAVAYC